MTITRERTGTSATAAGYAQFGRRHGRRDDACPHLARGEVASLNDAAPHHDHLYLICEPVEPTARAAGVGANVLAAIRDIYAASDRGDPVAAITAAVDAANEVLYTKNRADAPGLRVVLGLTCLIVRDRELLICQVPPTQTIVTQNGTPICLPELASRRDDYQPRAGEEPPGLGMRPAVTPLLFQASLEPDDLIVLCSSDLAARLATELPTLDDTPLAGDNPVAARDFLADLAEQHRLDSAYAAAIAPPVPGRRPGDGDRRRDLPATDVDPDESAATAAGRETETWMGRGLRGLRARGKVLAWPGRGDPAAAPVVASRHDPEAAADDGWAGEPSPAYDLQDVVADRPFTSPAGARPRGAGRRTRSRAASADQFADGAVPPDSTDTSAGAGWAGDGGDADADETPARGAVPRAARRARWGAALPQALWGGLAAMVLLAGGALERLRGVGGLHRRTSQLERRHGRVLPLGSLERWNGRGEGRWRRWMPLLVAVAIAAIAVVLVGAFRQSRARAAEERFTTALQRVGGAREAALAAPDRGAAYTQLLALGADLDALPDADRPGRPERVAAERAAVAAALDRVAGVERIAASRIETLATSPSASGAGAGQPRLVLGDGQPFVLLDGTLYGVDGRGKTPSKLLAKGDTVAGAKVGQLLGAVWRVDSLFAFDEGRGYLRDSAGAWSAVPLAAAGQQPVAADTFGGNLYLLAVERGQIAKFAAGEYAATPQPWSTKPNTELASAVDFTIDKNIYVLLADGRVLDLFQGELKATITPAVIPAAGANAIHAAPDGKYLYLLDAKEGRIIQLARDGAVVGAYKAGEGAPAFTGARDLVVDERAGLAFLLTAEGLLKVQLPAAR